MRKYSLYAVGEIALVVIGILIALSINNWNEGKKASKYERELLAELRLSLIKDIDHNTDAALPWIETFLNHGKIVAGAYGKPNTRIDTMEHHFNRMLRSPDFAYTKGAYETLKSNGLEKISNKEIRQTIIELYDFQIPRTERFIVEITRVNFPRILPLIDKLFTSEVSIDSLGNQEVIQVSKKDILQDVDLLNLILIKQGVGNNAIKNITRILPMMEDLKQQIEQELGL
jgi:hypothetical protein